MPRRLLFVVFYSFVLTSCASLIHRPTMYVNIYTDLDSATVYINDSQKSYSTPAQIEVERSNTDLKIMVGKDSVLNAHKITSRLSLAFWAGNFFNQTYGIGYAIDLTSPKRFTYPRNNYIILDSSNRFFSSGVQKPLRWVPPVRNQLSLKISIPEGNHFYINQGTDYGSAFGFTGLSAGLEYYVTDRYSINSDFAVMTDFMMPFPAPIETDVGSHRSTASILDIQLGYDIKSFHLDAGFQGNRTTYYDSAHFLLFPDNTAATRFTSRQFSAGLAFSGYYKFTNGFNLGLNYYPSLAVWNIGEFDFHYSHLITFEILFKIRLYRPQRADSFRKRLSSKTPD